MANDKAEYTAEYIRPGRGFSPGKLRSRLETIAVHGDTGEGYERMDRNGVPFVILTIPPLSEMEPAGGEDTEDTTEDIEDITEEGDISGLVDMVAEALSARYSKPQHDRILCICEDKSFKEMHEVMANYGPMLYHITTPESSTSPENVKMSGSSPDVIITTVRDVAHGIISYVDEYLTNEPVPLVYVGRKPLAQGTGTKAITVPQQLDEKPDAKLLDSAITLAKQQAKTQRNRKKMDLAAYNEVLQHEIDEVLSHEGYEVIRGYEQEKIRLYNHYAARSGFINLQPGSFQEAALWHRIFVGLHQYVQNMVNK